MDDHKRRPCYLSAGDTFPQKRPPVPPRAGGRLLPMPDLPKPSRNAFRVLVILARIKNNRPPARPYDWQRDGRP